MEVREGLELGENHAEHGDNPLTLPVSVTISILAVLVAGATLLGHRAHTEELLLQSQATDKWAYYQAKNIRSRNMQSTVDMLTLLQPKDEARAEAGREKYKKEVDRYESDKSDIGDEAKKLEEERDVVGRRADRFDGGEGILEVGLVICSVTLLTRRRMFWYSGMAIGAAGVALVLTGLFVH
ncbi:MAG TPA: DUF4337 domain-containing protein [Candidatus Acidoferrum sp.]